MAKIFKTKTGFFHILPDKIVLTRDHFLAARVTVGNNIARILRIYGAITVGLFYFGIKHKKTDKPYNRFYLD